MGIFRNREIRQLTLLLTLITGAVWGLSSTLPFIAGPACLFLSASFFFYTRKRYKTLSDLGEYLRKVNTGDYDLSLPGHDEGEISILKSEIYKVTVSLNEQNRQLAQEKARLSDALSDISHQIKTPLASMSVMADLLSGNTLEEGARREFSRRLKMGIGRLTWLTDTLLKLSRLDAGAVPFNLRLVPLSDLVQRACSPLLIPMDLKGVTLVVEAKGCAHCDPLWLMEALTNIVKNCMEQVPKGGTVTIRAGQNPLFAEIKIQDDGPGIDPRDLPFIFQRFYKGKGAGEESSGIGLAMAKAVVEAQGGTLKASNIQKGGACFTVQIPFTKVAR